MKKFKYEILLFSGLILLMLPSLDLPWSLVDDGLYLQEMTGWISAIKKDGVSAVFYESPFKKIINPGPAYFLLTLPKYLLFGKNPFWHHLLKIINFMICAFLVYFISFIIVKNRPVSCIAVLFFTLFAPVIDYTLDFQFYLANWYRLHATDSVIIFFCLLIFLILFYLWEKIYLNQRFTGKDWGLFSLAVFFYLIGINIKQSIVSVVLAGFLIFLFLLFLYLFKKNSNQLIYKREILFWGCWIASTFILTLLNLFIIKKLQTTTNFSYIKDYHLNLYEIRKIGFIYIRILLIGFGPILPLLIISYLWGFLKTLFKEDDITIIQRSQFFFLFAAFAAIAVYSPWQNVLTRYMPLMIAPLSLFMALELNNLWVLIKNPERDIPQNYLLPAKIISLFLIIGFLVLNIFPKIIFLISTMCVLSYFVKKEKLTWSSLKSLVYIFIRVLVVFCIFCFILFSVFSNLNFIKNYRAFERANNELVKQTAQSANVNQEVVFFMPYASELGGSIDIFLRLIYNRGDIKFRYINNQILENLDQDSLLIYHPQSSPFKLYKDILLELDQEQNYRGSKGTFISQNQSCGQTFTTGKYTKFLAKITVVLDDSFMDKSEKVVLTLWDSPQKKQLLASSAIYGRERPGRHPDTADFEFEPEVQVNPMQEYYFELNYTGKSGLRGRYTLFSDEDKYSQGTAFLNGSPQSYDMVFSVYSGKRLPIKEIKNIASSPLIYIIKIWDLINYLDFSNSLIPPVKLFIKQPHTHQWRIYKTSLNKNPA